MQGSKFKNIVKGSCPQCGKSNMWDYPAYKISKMTQMKRACPNCGQSFSPEPMFYQGAMYIGYAISVAIVITVFFAFHVLFEDPNIEVLMLTSVFVAVLLAPLNFRLSRNIWANMFIHPKNKD